jgi:hypothetical protein
MTRGKSSSFGGGRDRTFRAEKVDNRTLDGKLMLRRHFLEKYHADTKAVVLDCCQAEGRIWGQLRGEFSVKYWGVDRVAQHGRMAIDSVRLLAQPSLPYDVIDVDTYGSPWRHWETMLPNLVKPVSVFLTLGQMASNLANVDSIVLKAVGLKMSRAVPSALRWRLDQLAVDSCLAIAYSYGVQIIEAQEVLPVTKNARYFGLRLQPTTRAT